MEQKNTFKLLLVCLVIMLAVLPFVTTFNSALTALLSKSGLYMALQNVLVPFESRLVVSVVRVLGIPAFLAQGGGQADFYLLKNNQYFPVDLQWNCLGWQSILLLLLSFIPGLQGNFTLSSKLEAVAIGFLGTFLVNVFRMVFISAGVYYVNTVFALLIHDYFAAFVTIAWLMFFWWFAYSYVLEPKRQAPATP